MTRSDIMRCIRSTGNSSTERKLQEMFTKMGVTGYRRHLKDVFGRPDFVFLDEKVAVFTDGCFFHGCDDHYRPPKTNTKFWMRKINANRRRDMEAINALTRASWKVFRIWEHDIADAITLRDIVRRIMRAIDNPDEPGYTPLCYDITEWRTNHMCRTCKRKTEHYTKDVTGFGVYLKTICAMCLAATCRINGVIVYGGSLARSV